jgi:NAD(P)-dependent dehydrogenase (short-subunit alcohol dehydrogenase family)
VAKDFLEISDEDWDQMMNLNFMSGVRLSRAYLPGMKTRGWVASFSSQVNQGLKFRMK